MIILCDFKREMGCSFVWIKLFMNIGYSYVISYRDDYKGL